MKKEQQIEDILTAIRKACPELMELSFGCHVVAGGEPVEPREMIIGCPYEVRGTNVVNPYNLDDTNELFSIIGHDPHLDEIRMIIPKDKWGELILMWENKKLRDQPAHVIQWLHQSVATKPTV